MGSSSTTSSGEWTSAWASLARCFMPVEKVRIRRERSSSRPTWNSTSRGPQHGVAARQPAQLGHVDHQVAGRHVERQAVELGHVAQPPPHVGGVAGRVDARAPRPGRRPGAPARGPPSSASTCRRRWRRAGRSRGASRATVTSSSAVIGPKRFTRPSAAIRRAASPVWGVRAEDSTRSQCRACRRPSVPPPAPGRRGGVGRQVRRSPRGPRSR